MIAFSLWKSPHKSKGKKQGATYGLNRDTKLDVTFELLVLMCDTSL